MTPRTSRQDLWTWVTLLFLTITSFAVSEGADGRLAVVAILIAAAAKAGLVGFQFMRLREGHAIWRLAFGAMLACFVVLMATVRMAT